MTCLPRSSIRTATAWPFSNNSSPAPTTSTSDLSIALPRGLLMQFRRDNNQQLPCRRAPRESGTRGENLLRGGDERLCWALLLSFFTHRVAHASHPERHPRQPRGPA